MPTKKAPKQLSWQVKDKLWNEFGERYIRTVAKNNLHLFKRVYSWYTVGDAMSDLTVLWLKVLRKFDASESYEDFDVLTHRVKAYYSTSVINMMRNLLKHSKKIVPQTPFADYRKDVSEDGGGTTEEPFESSDYDFSPSTDLTNIKQLLEIEAWKLQYPYDEIAKYLAINYRWGGGVWEAIEEKWKIDRQVIIKNLRTIP
jgi:hypothetical protein